VQSPPVTDCFWQAEEKQASVQKCLDEGKAFYAQNEWDSAVNSFTHALLLDAYNISALMNRSMCHLNLKEYDRAINDCTDLLKLDSRYVLAYMCLGQVWFQKKDFGKASEQFNLALELEPSNQEARQKLSQSRASLERSKESKGAIVTDYLRKKASRGLHRWQSRLFELYEHALVWEKSKGEKGVIALKSIEAVTITDKDKFTIKYDKGTMCHLMAVSSEELDRWTSAIVDCLENATGIKPKVESSTQISKKFNTSFKTPKKTSHNKQDIEKS